MAVKELENKIKSAVSSLSRPGGVVDMTWLEEKDESSEDDPTPSPEPTPDPTPDPVVQYTLTFSGGDGTSGMEENPSPLTVDSGTVVDLSEYTPNPTYIEGDHSEGEGYWTWQFMGWYDTSSYNEDTGMYEYNILSSITVDSDTTLYSRWESMEVTPDPEPVDPPAEEPIE